MKKIDLTAYSIGSGNTFDIRTSLVAVLFNEKVDPRELLKRDALATRIEQWEGDTLLLENAEWQKVVGGLSATDLKPFGRDVVEFVRRVLDAPDVSVVEART